ncbi:hypothetical protein [Vibrio cortegadensis]|uniref:hypothetical protein n=1 Tax=Vibrio cortegadensis TaxID=1328770 RepID=UPI0021C30211|nr:hypothetical protein [Vibrio cortegadensis]
MTPHLSLVTNKKAESELERRESFLQPSHTLLIRYWLQKDAALVQEAAKNGSGLDHAHPTLPPIRTMMMRFTTKCMTLSVKGVMKSIEVYYAFCLAMKFQYTLLEIQNEKKISAAMLIQSFA